MIAAAKALGGHLHYVAYIIGLNALTLAGKDATSAFTAQMAGSFAAKWDTKWLTGWTKAIVVGHGVRKRVGA